MLADNSSLSIVTDTVIIDGNRGSIFESVRREESFLPATALLWQKLGANASRTSSPEPTNGYVRLTYPAQSCSPGDTYNGNLPETAAVAGQLRPDGGTQFSISGPSVLHARATYKFRLKPGFNPMHGGKLPGLASQNTSASGGLMQNAGTVSFTARLMWQPGLDGALCRVIPYYYMADNMPRWTGTEPIGANLGVTQNILPDDWNYIVQEVKLNDVGFANGSSKITVNGITMLDRNDLVWRLNNSLTIDQLWFSSFFGGNSRDNGDGIYETLVDTYIDFGDMLYEKLG